MQPFQVLWVFGTQVIELVRFLLLLPLLLMIVVQVCAFVS
jgi:hypothetical protein